MKPSISQSKYFTKILRHSAEEENIELDQDGFALVDDLLKKPFLNNLSKDDVKEMVDTCSKKRFKIKYNSSGGLIIAANQGHSIKIHSSLLTPLNLDNIDFDYIIHGTYYKVLDSIKRKGLSKMNRVHIHFSTKLPEDGVISGMRKSCQVYVLVDIKKAINDGYNFYKSENDVILTEGNKDGYILPKYIYKIIDRKTKRDID